MQLTRLKLTGFKSFVEATELLIEPGLTGIVGPNGCGKSNLVEALRWVMGETSAKQMRGGEMDDVIFAGTAARPARNLAEVVLHLDNSARDAPAAYNDSSEIEVSRRIERGSGSQYRINGKEARARDVQLLFADAATGARSTALVSQGQVGAVIGAKPVERRLLLEEAAGITGLHSRRHEAELRLRAADTNLERLDDVLAALQAQLQGLKRQARQAVRYRSLSGRLRKADAMLHYRRWSLAEAEVAETRDTLAAIQARAAERAREAASASTAQAEAAQGLPGLRQAEAEAAATAQRLAVAREGLDEEDRRVAEATEALIARLRQIDDDTAREDDLKAQAAQAVTDLAEEANRLRAEQAGEAEATSESKARLETARATVAAHEALVAASTDEVAATEARRESLERRIAELADRFARLGEEAGQVERERTTLSARVGDSARLDEAEAALASAREDSDTRHAALEATHRETQAGELARDAAEAAERSAREASHGASSQRARLTAESEALQALLARDGPSDAAPPVLDRITVEAGLEAALGAALGDDLLAATEAAAPTHWRKLKGHAPPPPLPDGAEPLAKFVMAPAELSRRLAQVGLVDAAEGARLQPVLAQGQRLVSRDGALWRWDGYTASAEAPNAAGVRLRQQKRLDSLRADLAAAESDFAARQSRLTNTVSTLEQARAATQDARRAETAARDAARDAYQALNDAREAQIALVDAVADDRSRLSALSESAARLAKDSDDAGRDRGEAEATLAALPDPEAVRSPLEEKRAALAGHRAEYDDCARAHERLGGEARARAARLAATARETATWDGQGAAADKRTGELAARREAADRELAGLRARPAAIQEQRRTLMQRTETAEAWRDKAADALAVAETRLAECDRAARVANEAQSTAREDKARADGKLEQAVSLCNVEVARIHEKFTVEPALVLDLAEVQDADKVPELETLERQVERLHRERDNMGAVNLRAEEEANELSQQIETMESERADLIAAIARLRSGIASLNREGRQRLLKAFEEVDKHFQELFVRLFGGGRAHLSLIGDDDPLEAGLEIMACPPGKRLQVLSLLSGGEKALAALSLLFAVFLTKPAPICVLDEVDAPLDDTNVDRFCSLVEEMARGGTTRFLVITHHRLTMARMDRLFGVTMGERGVSQLVSVDLGQVHEMRAAE